MAAKTIAELQADILARFPNNTTQLITPTITRSQFSDLADSCLNKVDLNPSTIFGSVDFIGGLRSNGSNILGNAEVIVNSASDLPSPIGGVITLAANTTYRISGNINIGTDRILFSANSGLLGSNRFVDGITYSGTSNMFTATTTHTIQELALYHTGISGAVFNCNGSGTETLVYTNSYIAQAYSAGTINDWRTIVFRSFSITGCTDRGLLLDGTCGTLAITQSTFANNAGISLDLGTATFDSVQIDSGNKFSVASTQTAISGAASSANINSGGHGTIHGTIFSGVGTFLNGITTSDLRWYLHANGGAIGDSSTAAQGYINGSALNTTFSGTGPGNEVVVNFGTDFDVDIEKRFTISNAGVFTYTGIDPIEVMIDSSIYATIAGGTNRSYIFYWYKSGVKQIATGATVEYDGSTPDSSSCCGLLSLVNGDTIDLRVQAVAATTSLNVQSVNVNIYGV